MQNKKLLARSQAGEEKLRKNLELVSTNINRCRQTRFAIKVRLF